MSDMEQWVKGSLSEILEFPVPEDLTQYILQMQNEKDIDEGLGSLLDYGNPRHKQFVTDFKKRQGCLKDKPGSKKTNVNEFLKESLARKQMEKKKGKAKGREIVQPQEPPPMIEKPDRKKTKFVNLYSQEGQDRATILLKGRHKCNCEAKTHALINNCSNCGRIVCSQEGSGPCFFCGEIVCSPDEQIILASNSKKADQLYNKLKSQKPTRGLEDSIKHRDRLLENDRNSAKCTHVIDDESDYYQSNSTWLTASEREKLQKLEEEMQTRKHASRLTKKMTFDFAGRTVVEEDDKIDDRIGEQQFQELCESIPFDDLNSSNICPTFEFDRPNYIEGDSYMSRTGKTSNIMSIRNRIQDKEYQEISDKGVCLSMHQPYASLLVAGIKTHEGRTWYSSHRGRLWIAATVKVPATEDISTLQNTYRVLKGEKIKFPEHYPSGCLLGCVTVVDVLPQEEYRKIYPDGESESPYVFICEDCHMLPIKFPIQGKHKIYKLEQKIHQAALKSLEKVLRERSGS